MKNFKRPIVTALVVLSALSTFSSCGKKNNASTDPGNSGVIGSVSGGQVIGISNPTSGGPTSCFQPSANSTATFSIGSSSVQVGQTGITALAAVVSNYSAGGTHYVRMSQCSSASYQTGDCNGDNIDLYLNGTVNSTGQLVASVRLTPNVTAAIAAVGQCVSGIYFYQSLLSPGNPGILQGPIYLLGKDGNYLRNYYGQPMTL